MRTAKFGSYVPYRWIRSPRRVTGAYERCRTIRIRPAGADATYSTYTRSRQRRLRTVRGILTGREYDMNRRRQSAQGFTLIELMIVMTIILILLGMAAPRYEKAVTKAREAKLHTDLQVMRQAIDNYTLDKEAAPQSLDDMVQAGYLREIPVDPMTQLFLLLPQPRRSTLFPYPTLFRSPGRRRP